MAGRFVFAFYGLAMLLMFASQPLAGDPPKFSRAAVIEMPAREVTIPQADEPPPVFMLAIVGPRSVQPGAIIRLDADCAEATDWKWAAVDVSAPTEVPDLMMSDIVNGGKTLILQSVAGRTYAVFASVSDKTGRQAAAVAVVTVDGAPGPGPGPTPPNPDSPPVGKLGLAKVSIDGAASIPAGPQKASEAKGIAANYRAIIAQAKALQSPTLEGLQSSLKALNRSTLTDATRIRWNDWQAAVEDGLEKADADKKIAGVAGALAAWDEVATGLEWLAAKEGR